MFSSAFICLFVYAKTTQPIFIKFGGKVEHGPRKKQLDFRDNHLTL